MLGGHNQSSAHHHNEKLSAKCLLAENIRLYFFWKQDIMQAQNRFLSICIQ